MSGVRMFVLARECEDRESAIGEAESTVDSLWEDGLLVEGDHGHGPWDEADEEKWEVISAKATPETFRDKVYELQEDRRTNFREYVDKLRELMAKHGIEHLRDIPLEEDRNEDRGIGMLGYYLHVAGELEGRSFIKYGALYDAQAKLCGVGEKTLKELLAKPDDVWLVEICVG